MVGANVGSGTKKWDPIHVVDDDDDDENWPCA